MTPCTRGPAPELLAREGAQIGREYATRRRETLAFRFQWPRRDGQSLLAVVREALAAMTAGHCAYCDGRPIDSVGAEAVDHFRPKSHPSFYELVCSWTNLFLTCTACNHSKAETWDEALLRPDELDFSFERYFEYRFDTGTLQPAPTATAEDQQRAVRTIEILHLNRAGACASRRRAVQWMRAAIGGDELDSLPYRYLLPLSRPM